MAAQSKANAAQAKQQRLEQELRIADVAFTEEKKIRTREIAAAHQTIGALRHDLQDATTRLEEQGAVLQGVVDVTEN